jgi:formate-dependent nitrite reductase cytochrome c552 subunit
MKNLKLIGFLMILLSSLVFIQCTSDVITGPQGIAGIDGSDGTNGTNGTNGTDGTDGTDGVGAASCITCHSDSHREPIESSYAQSDHANQSIMYDGRTLAEYANRTSCAECHTNEGYIEFQETGAVAAEFTNPTAISCTTCHDTHGTFDFENDGYDYALRSFGPMELRNLDLNYTIDYGDKSNNCIECHQPRSTFPEDDGAGMYNITSGYYGPHYGAQSTMLEGIQGAEIAGSTEYPTAVSSTHRNGASCVSCHMGEANEEDGQHTMMPTLNTCTTCHGSGAETLMANLQVEVDGYLTELEGLLKEQGVLDADNKAVTGEHPILIANAFWNWKFNYQDHSKGVHNPAYTRALLKNSIEALEAL